MKKNRLVAVLLAAAMLVVMCACGGTAASSTEPPAESAAPTETAAPSMEPEPEPPAESVISAEDVPDYDEVFAVVHTNDVHGFIDVEPYVKAVADSLKEEYGQENVITVSAGDVFAGGNAVAHLYNGETIPPIMDAAGYDLLAPGNNDFNLGGEQLVVLGNMAEHMTTVCANLYETVYDENGEAVLDENEEKVKGETIFDRTMERTTAGGVKVGLFGLTISGGPVEDTFASQGSVEAAQEAVDLLTADDCSVIIGVGHTGWNDDLVTPSSNDVTSAELVKEVSGIDAYVDGHSHSIINDGAGWICPETGTLVNQASCKGACVGVMLLYIKDGKVIDKQAELIMEDELKADYTPDPETQAAVDAAWAQLERDAGEMYMESEVFLNALRTTESSDGRSVRTDETNLGDLVTDALRHAAKADVALMPGFRIRASLSEGKVYAVNLYDVFANGCDLYTFEMTGQELLEKMANSLIDLPNESTQFNQISGASYGYLTTHAENEDGSKTFTIVDPKVNGEPLDVNKTYVVAMDAGGPDAPEDQDPVLSGMEAVAEAVGEFMRTPECMILPDEPTPDHRIMPMTEADIPADAVTYEVTIEMMAPPGAPPA